MQKKTYFYVTFFLSSISMLAYSLPSISTDEGKEEVPAKPKSALPGLLQKLLGQNQPIFQEEVETTQLKQHLEVINNIGKIDDKIILYSIYDTFYFSVLQQNQQPISADTRENLYAFKNDLKKQVLADRIAHFTKTHAKPPLEAERQAIEHAAEQHYDHIIAMSLEDKLERIQTMEKMCVASARDEKERQARRLMFDWTQLRISDIMQARSHRRSSFLRRHRSKLIAVGATIATGALLFAGYNWWNKSQTPEPGGYALLNGEEASKRSTTEQAIERAAHYFSKHFSEIATEFNASKGKEDVFWSKWFKNAWKDIEYSLEGVYDSYDLDGGEAINSTPGSTDDGNVTKPKPSSSAKLLKIYLVDTPANQQTIFSEAIKRGLGDKWLALAVPYIYSNYKGKFEKENVRSWWK